MQIDEFQIKATETAIYPAHMKITYPALGLAGEVGEVCDKIKKIFRDDAGILSDEKRTEIEKELGDVLWYLAAVAEDLDIPLERAALGNLEKLASRAERGVLQGSGDNR